MEKIIKKILLLTAVCILGLITLKCTSLNKNQSRELSNILDLDESLAQNENKFLIKMGFEDFSAKATANLDLISSQQKKSSALVPHILQENADRYQFINSIRDLAVSFRVGLDHAEKNNRLPQALDDLTILAAYHLMPFALVGLEPIPKSVFNFKTGDQALELREKYLIEQNKKRFIAEKSALFNALASNYFLPAEINNPSQKNASQFEQINEIIEESIAYQYEFTGLQQSRYLGRALAATLLRFTRSRNLLQYENKLADLLKNKNQFLSNHISSKLTFVNRQGVASSFNIKSGDIANEYSTGPEAYHITVGVLPGDQKGRQAAKDLDGLASMLQLPAKAFNPMIEYAMARKKANYDLTEDQQRILNEVWDERQIKGFSHAGFTDVRKDVESGIEMVWVWDIYPYGNFGGVRFQTPENFAYSEKYNRIGFVSYDPKALLKHFQDTYARTGYKENIWQSHGSKVIKTTDDEFAPAIDMTRTVDRKTFVGQSTLDRWMTYKPENADNWFQNEVAPRAIQAAQKFLVDENAHTFSQGFHNRESSSYCSQFIYLAFLQGAHLELQKNPDQWSGLVKLMSKIGLGDYPVNDRIVSPTGFAWQKDLVQSVYQVNLNRQNYHDQISNHPKINGKPTVIADRLSILQPLASRYKSSPEIKFDIESELDTDDDDL